MFFQNRRVRTSAITLYRAYAQCIFFYPQPRILVNSVPKAGTHLLRMIVAELPRVMLSGVHIRVPEVHQADVLRQTNVDFELDPVALRHRLLAAHPGQVVTAHLPWRSAAESVLRDVGVKTIFLIRDPRDVVVSYMHYVVGLRRNLLHRRIATELSTDAERLMACIKGMPARSGDDWIPSIDSLLDERLGWARMADIHVTRFEDLVGARGGGDVAVQREEIKAIAAHVDRPLDDAGVDRLVGRVSGRSSFTFRRGVIGDWRSHFTEEHRRTFKELAGRHLIEFGYETGFDW
jgi:hypothetical protein